MTSNLGTADLRKSNVGFGGGDANYSYEKMKDKAMDALKGHFRPEFLNRVDEVIVFAELSKDEVIQIVDLFLDRLRVQLLSQGLGLELTQEAKLYVAEKGYDPTMGARPLRREIQKLVENPMSEMILKKDFHAGETILVDVTDKLGEDGNVIVGEKTITFKSMPTITTEEAPSLKAHEEDIETQSPKASSGISKAAGTKKPKAGGTGTATTDPITE